MENSLTSGNVFSLVCNELMNGQAGIPFLGEMEQLAFLTKLNLPDVEDGPSCRIAQQEISCEEVSVLRIFFPVLDGHNGGFLGRGAPIGDRLEDNLDSQSLFLMVIEKNVVSDTLLHGPVVVGNNFFEVGVDNFLD